jgi:hypothetical protein
MGRRKKGPLGGNVPQIKRQCVGKKATYVPLRNVTRGPVAPVRTQPAATADSHEASSSGQWQETDAGAEQMMIVTVLKHDIMLKRRQQLLHGQRFAPKFSKHLGQLFVHRS